MITITFAADRNSTTLASPRLWNGGALGGAVGVSKAPRDTGATTR
jgi:hypothetical protein